MIRVNAMVFSEEHFGGIIGRVSRVDIDDAGNLEGMVVCWDDIGRTAGWRFPEKNPFRQVEMSIAPNPGGTS